LIEWGQKHKVDIAFELVDAKTDEQNNPTFVSCVKASGIEIGSGTGYSKKESHQKAAKVAMKQLRNDLELQKTLIEEAKRLVAEIEGGENDDD